MNLIVSGFRVAFALLYNAVERLAENGKKKVASIKLRA